MGNLPFENLKREIITLFDEKQTPVSEQPIKELLNTGIIIIDKPAGPTSHQVSDQVKRILKIKKAGHSGTLDPNVTGILPVALDNGTKVIQALLNAGKEYICIMHVHEDIPEDKLKEVIMSFQGKITQLPPVKSAVKRQERIRHVYYIEILEIKDRDVFFKVGCQGGTYIRKLCSDIGEKLGCGAHMSQLRRTKAGPFKEDQIHTLHDLADAYHAYKNGDESLLRNVILPQEAGIDHLPKIWVKDSSVKTICHGAQLKMPGIARFETKIKKDEMVAVLDSTNKLVLLGNAQFTSKELSKKKQGTAVKTLRVFKII
jgi:H/ACA ribonucleoprotein complex subunit 4